MSSTPKQKTQRSSRVRPGLGAKIALLLLSSLMAFCAVELALRLRKSGTTFIYRKDPHYLYGFRPGARYQRTLAAEDGGLSFPVEINREARRGSPADPDRPKIVVYGDSNIAAEYCPYDKTFTAQLERLLTEHGRPCQVVNCGVTGYGPDQELIRMRQEASSLSPKLIVVALTTWNDLGDIIRNRLFSLDSQGNLVDRRPVLSHQLKVLFESNDPRGSSLFLHYLARGLGGFRGRESLDDKKKSQAPPTRGLEMLEYWRQVRVEEYQVSRDPSQLVVDNLFVDTADSDVFLDPESEQSRYKLKLLEGVVRGMISHAKSMNVPILFVTIPGVSDVYGKFDETVLRKAYPGHRKGGISESFEEVLKGSGAANVRLVDVFASRPEGETFLPIDGHWSPVGQRLAAAEVARWIESKSILPHSNPTAPGSRAAEGH